MNNFAGPAGASVPINSPMSLDWQNRAAGKSTIIGRVLMAKN